MKSTRILVLAICFQVVAVGILPAQEAVYVNNLKKKFIPSISNAAIKQATREGIVCQYLVDSTLLVSVGLEPWDKDTVFLHLYIKNNSGDALPVDPMTLRCTGTTLKDQLLPIPILDPVKYFKNRLGPEYPMGEKPQISYQKWVSSLAISTLYFRDVLPGEEYSGLVFVRQLYDLLTTARPGQSATRNETLFKDITVVVPLAGKDYTFAFTVDNSTK